MRTHTVFIYRSLATCLMRETTLGFDTFFVRSPSTESEKKTTVTSFLPAPFVIAKCVDMLKRRGDCLLNENINSSGQRGSARLRV